MSIESGHVLMHIYGFPGPHGLVCITMHHSGLPDTPKMTCKRSVLRPFLAPLISPQVGEGGFFSRCCRRLRRLQRYTYSRAWLAARVGSCLSHHSTGSSHRRALPAATFNSIRGAQAGFFHLLTTG